MKRYLTRIRAAQKLAIRELEDSCCDCRRGAVCGNHQKELYDIVLHPKTNPRVREILGESDEPTGGD